MFLQTGYQTVYQIGCYEPGEQSPVEKTPPPDTKPSACDWQELLQDDLCLRTSAASAQSLHLCIKCWAHAI